MLIAQDVTLNPVVFNLLRVARIYSERKRTMMRADVRHRYSRRLVVAVAHMQIHNKDTPKAEDGRGRATRTEQRRHPDGKWWKSRRTLSLNILISHHCESMKKTAGTTV